MKLPILSAKDIIKALKMDGFKPIRQRGSHISLCKTGGDKTYLVVVPDKKRGENRDSTRYFKAGRDE